VIRTEERTVPTSADVARIAHDVPSVTTDLPHKMVKRTRRSTPRRSARSKTLPKLEQFPVPTQLTAEERTLLAFAERNPKVAQDILAEMQRQNDEPVEIVPIQIPPLRSDGAQ
jgi:hypothetical protein